MHAGVMLAYSVWQVCVLIMMYIAFMFWAVLFPLSYRQLKISGKIRYAHIISVVLAVVVPLPGALIILKEGYTLTPNPPYTCIGRDADYNYYAFTLPICVICATTTCLMAIIFWTILKVVNKSPNNLDKIMAGPYSLPLSACINAQFDE